MEINGKEYPEHISPLEWKNGTYVESQGIMPDFYKVGALGHYFLDFEFMKQWQILKDKGIV